MASQSMETRSLYLANKPGAALKLSTYFAGAQGNDPGSDTLVVFLNGLGLPRASWLPAIEQFISDRRGNARSVPSLLAYDRYGQGQSDPDPTDPTGTPYGHDALAVATDLHHIISRVKKDYLAPTPANFRLVFVCNSIGCAIARLYASEHPGSVAGFLFLDSIIANTDFVSIYPDPHSPEFDPGSLPTDVSVNDLQHAREAYRRMFHPTVPNPERFDRRFLPELLPHSDKPELPPGPEGRTPRLVVVGHDWDEFADQTEKVTFSYSPYS